VPIGDPIVVKTVIIAHAIISAFLFETRRSRGRRPVLASEQELSDFLKSIERRAFKRVLYSVRDEDAALDIVQDAMIRLAQTYADRPVSEFPMLFQRIVSNATLDWFRRQKVRNALFRNFSDFEGSEDGEDFDVLENLEALGLAGGVESAADNLDRSQVLRSIELAIENLPARQREAFLLRYWEEMDVAETAAIMGCSEGSVKAHCSRAVNALATALRNRGIEP
jgi:RNA polymerase sigma-70 factor (ECF subfamily)